MYLDNYRMPLETYIDKHGFAFRDHSEWLTRKIVQADKEKAHVAVTFNRYRKDNSLIAVETSFYIMEKRLTATGASEAEAVSPSNHTGQTAGGRE